ncbi:hypothetical protein H2198_005291 [Neophaeococcomyces mojaviensis]|uniref:Uncharacterized protein n=1 Tax=Neophaeococcomyces mojaviensis TaxID=3383035 RepID=A0ACC3A605_9EURO|nr:hypothetical protein H2198_005291 [Knufia sp. JES_112]
MIQKIAVLYDSTDHSDIIQEIDGKSNELMKGHGGSDVYLYVEARTLKPEDALSSLNIAIENDERCGWSDLSKGAGGTYVYLECERNASDHRITEVRLLRSSEKSDIDYVRSRGYDGMTGDICDGRGGDYVYLIWKTTRLR